MEFINRSEILQDPASFQHQRETLMLLKLAVQGDRDYQQGRVFSDADADAHFQNRLTAHRSDA